MPVDIDNLIVQGGSATAGGDYELIDQGTYVVTITDIQPYEGTVFGTSTPETKLKFYYTVDADPRNTVPGWEQFTVDEIVNIPKNMANPKADLGMIWKAATGETPQEGGKYPIKKGLVGKKLLLVIGHKPPNTNGSIWAKVRDHLELPAAGGTRRRPAPAPAAPAFDADDDSDDMKDA